MIKKSCFLLAALWMPLAAFAAHQHTHNTDGDPLPAKLSLKKALGSGVIFLGRLYGESTVAIRDRQTQQRRGNGIEMVRTVRTDGGNATALQGVFKPNDESGLFRQMAMAAIGVGKTGDEFEGYATGHYYGVLGVIDGSWRTIQDAGEDGAPSGQPLPGVLMALLLGGGAVIGGNTLFRRRRACAVPL